MVVLAQSIQIDDRVSVYNQYADAQTFTPLSTGYIGIVSLPLSMENGLTDGPYRLSIRATSGGTPLAGAVNDLAYIDFDSTSVPAISEDYTWVDLDFGGTLQLISGTQYALCLRYPGSGADNTLRWHSKGSNVYGGGKAWNSSNRGNTSWVTSVGDIAFIINDTTPEVSTPTLEYPDNELENVYLNSDWSMQFRWDDEDEVDIGFYTVWFFDPFVGWSERSDRSRYTILEGLSMYMDYGPYERESTYSWFVRKTLEGVDYDSETWSFTTIPFNPPLASGTSIVDGEVTGTATGENGIITVRRLVVAAANKIWYEQ